jgi:hypothetical protein
MIVVFVLKPRKGSVCELSRLFAIIMEHELLHVLHVLDEIEIGSKWISMKFLDILAIPSESI